MKLSINNVKVVLALVRVLNSLALIYYQFVCDSENQKYQRIQYPVDFPSFSMRKAFFLLVLSILFSLHENRETLQFEVTCDVIDLAKYIEFPYGHRCLQVFANKNSKVNCMLKSFGLNAILLKMYSFSSMNDRDISSEAQDNCETFLLFVESLNDTKEIFKTDQDLKKQFFPFSKIYFYIFEDSNESKTTNTVNSTTQLRSFLIGNALFGYKFKVTKEGLGNEAVIEDLLTNDTKRPTLSYTPSDLFHPIVDTSLPKDNFRISLFNCKPFTFYRENASYNTIIDEMDGTEIRFVKEVTKNWKKTFKLQDFSRTKAQPYTSILNDVSNSSSDLAMCSIWLLERHYKFYDLTTFYNQLCSTFLVPKPIKLNEATAIYTALSTQVWLLFLGFFFLSSVSLNFVSKLEKRLSQQESQYMDFTMSLMETVNTVTSHPAHNFPRENGQAPVKILLTSWILFSVWIDLIYATAYTSRLTSPSYEKPIDSVKQFLDYGLSMCSPYTSTAFIEGFNASVNEDYRQLGTRSLVYGENRLQLQRLIADRKCGVFAHHPTKYYVAFKTQNEERDFLPTFRMMKDCVLTHFSGFVFQKYSPYTKLFNWHIRRYQEHGIIRKWYVDVSKDQKGYEKIFEDHPKYDSFRQIYLANVSGAFSLLCAGLLLSVISFFVEVIKHRRNVSITAKAAETPF